MHKTRARMAAAVVSVGLSVIVAVTPCAVADPEVDAPSGPSAADAPPPIAFPLFQFALPNPTPDGQDATPFTGVAPFDAPTIHPSDGSTVGVAMPIIIKFSAPIGDRAAAEDAIHIWSDPPVPGKFYWMSDSQVRWRPIDFWPAHTVVNVDAAGTTSRFSTGDALVATADDATHQLTITRNGAVEHVFPMSMGKPGHDTPNGTYYVQQKFSDIVMDSATYGVPSSAPDGYRVDVELAVQFDNSGKFVHSAPWSIADQGVRNVSHGCINVSPANAQWFYDNFGVGDPIVVTNSVGSYSQNDGSQDWMI
ncbi:Ig-like domain-containing protein [Mycobacterium sp. NPDC048908]|uniref:L,D-transpeptidase n=1 Tax=Mycobacterium sp. NPDC048908 TaxID=3364292 RepID=UPI00371031B4